MCSVLSTRNQFKRSFEKMRKLDGSGPPRSYQPQVVPRSSAGPGSIELQPVAQSENSAYRKRRSAGKFSGGVCCASFRSRIDWEKKSAGKYGGGVETMEDPDTIDSEVEPPQKAGLRGLFSSPPRLLQPQQQQHSSSSGYGSCAHLEQILQQPKEHGGNQDGGFLWVKIGGDGLKITAGAVFDVLAAKVPRTTQTWASTTINTSMLFYCRILGLCPKTSKVMGCDLKISDGMGEPGTTKLLGLDPKTAKVMGRGQEDLRWYARAWNHELRLPPALHLFHKGKRIIGDGGANMYVTDCVLPGVRTYIESYLLRISQKV
ncbi:hypothetical protein EAF00_000152 [Botryotinia globosa]|nr:hypothetical protein EAF00_000152 [Botryotinia globosa]